MECPHCAAVLPDDDLFCEECGKPLKNENAPLCLCGAPEGDLDEDGYCLQCGRRCRPAPGDHVEIELSPDFAAVSDRGRHHHRNEDRCAIAERAERKLLVICDGVSSSIDAQVASQSATDAAMQSLAEGATLAAAIAAASEAVRQLGREAGEVAPSTTVVAATVCERSIDVAWLGDSRAYWVSEANSRQLTADHSWVNEVVAAGEVSYAEAVKSPRAHGITRWLGADADAELQPGCVEFRAAGAGSLVLCTDGLWNYADELSQMAALARPESGESALETSRRLVAFANDSGGQDNVSVAIFRFSE